jgi:hypothetical protein
VPNVVPIVIWLENESFNLVVREAPDLTQWISDKFLFPTTTTGQPGSLRHGPFSDIDSRTRELVKDALPDDIVSDALDASASGKPDAVRETLRLLLAAFDAYRQRGDVKKEEWAIAKATEIATPVEDLAVKQNIELRRADLFRRLRQPKRAIQVLRHAFPNLSGAAYPRLQVDLAWLMSA